MKHLGERILALGMALCLCLSLCTVPANAAEEKLSETVGEEGAIRLSLSLTKSGDNYMASYTAKTELVEWLAKTVAVGKDDPRIANVRITCTLTDELTKTMNNGDLGKDNYTFTGVNNILVLDEKNAVKVKDGSVRLCFKVNTAALRAFDGAKEVEEAVRQPVTMTSQKMVISASALADIGSTIHTTAQVDITMTRGKIPFYNEDIITVASGKINTRNPVSMDNFFVDVPTTEYYYDAVLWAAENGITNGVDADHFGPEIGVTRAQVVTFLWRAAGSPEPKGDTSKFTDLIPNEYYIKAVAWAIEQGITKGMTDTTFDPETVCTRGQIVTFLARFAGAEDADAESIFADVLTTDFFAAAVKWAKENGVTEGTSDTTFEPYTNCSRAQVVTFLYRWMVK